MNIWATLGLAGGWSFLFVAAVYGAALIVRHVARDRS